MSKNKYVKVGIGTSFKDDSYQAAKEAAEKSKKDCDGELTFSIVYVSSRYNPKQILCGINEVLGDKWVGCSADTQFTSKEGYHKTNVIVLSISSDYLHFSVGTSDNYRDNPIKAGEEAISKAMNSIKIDKYVDPYIQFRRTQTKSFTEIVRTPPYFILTLISGTKYVDSKPIPGMETEFVEGVFNVTGPTIPIIGASASTDFDEYQKQIGNNFQYANGKLYYNAGVTIFVVSSLNFSFTLEHGYSRTDKVALLTKLDETGHIIKEINNKPAVEEYANILGIDKEQFMKNPFNFTLPRPMGLIDTNGALFIKEAVPNDENTMYCLCKLAENSAVNIVDYDQEKTINAVSTAISEANSAQDKQAHMAFSLVFSCCGRKALLGKNVAVEISRVKEKFPHLPFFGFHSFGEIGAKPNRPSQTVNQSVSVLTIYDKLLTE